MPQHNDYTQLLKSLVTAVDAYVEIDWDWDHIATKDATKARERMYQAARQIMFQMSGESLTDSEIEDVFWS